MVDIIKQAYAFTDATEFFYSKMNKEFILSLRKELDYVYNLLESLDIVSPYNKDRFEIDKDFEVVRTYDTFYLIVGSKSKEIIIDNIINEVVVMFERV